MRIRPWPALFLLGFLLQPHPTTAQTIELAGSRAPGMGGAFVAVASDSSATWWNPAGLAAGPFVDLALVRNAAHGASDTSGAWRERLSAFTFATPPAGVSYFRFRLTNISPEGSTATGPGDRQAIGTGVPVRSVPASQLGVTLVHSLFDGIHVGTTLKYVRGKVLAAASTGTTGDLLDAGDGLEGDDADGTFDLDVGVLAVLGAIRAGGVIRNVRAAELGGPEGVALPRQVRVGVAIDGDTAWRLPLTLAADVDVRRYDGPGGERQVIALGAEHWLLDGRLGVRAGARTNVVGHEERAATGGVSVAVRSGLYLDGHVVASGSSNERGWGVAARVSF